MHSHDAALVHALADQRGGVVSRQQLVRARFDHELPSREVAAGRWQVLLPGIYVVSSEPPSFVQVCHAALLHGGRESLLTAEAGCFLLGSTAVVETPESAVALVPHRVRRVSRNGVELRRSRHLPEPVLVRRQGQVDLRVAPLARCVADAVHGAGDLSDARALGARAIRDESLVWEEVRRIASRPGQGPGHLPRVVRDIEDGVRSAPEGELHDTLFAAARAGTLPPYLLNPDVYVDGVLLGSPDAWFPGLGLGDEMDSREWHEEAGMLDATLLRHERFGAHRVELCHITPARFRASPRAHVARLAELVATRRALACPEPAGLVVLGRGPLLPARSPWPQVPPHRVGLGQFRRDAAA